MNDWVATESSEMPRVVRFDRFEIDLRAQQLRKDGRNIKLQDQPFRILEFLVRHSNETVLRDELYACLPVHGTYDSKHGLDNAIQKIRKALGDSVQRPRFVETIRGRGYRFLLNVEFNPNPNGNSHERLERDPFLEKLKKIREEFLVTNAPERVAELFHRVDGLLDCYSDHPNHSEGRILLNSIYSVLSEQNRVTNKVSFETASMVFQDPHALSLLDHVTRNVWHTLGRVCQTSGLFRRSALLFVTHEHICDQDGRIENRIMMARKATRIESTNYEVKKKSTR